MLELNLLPRKSTGANLNHVIKTSKFLDGWPPLVNLIFNQTHSANYELEDLPREVREKALLELGKLKNGVDKRTNTKLRRADTSKHATATFVGWKAPIAMVLLPLLKEVFGPIKFLHVVRDGR